MGQAYREILRPTRAGCQLQMHMYAAAGDPEIREVVRAGYGDLVTSVRAGLRGGVRAHHPLHGQGMLLNVIAAMQLRESGLAWAERLFQGCWATTE